MCIYNQAKVLTFPEVVTTWNIEKLKKLIMNGPSKHPGCTSVRPKDGYRWFFLEKYQARQHWVKSLKCGDVVRRHLNDKDIVLFNRQPSLHRVSIMSHYVKVLNHKTLRFNPCVCNPYNADFDGDEMNIHVPQTQMARAEAKYIMNVKHNFCAPKSPDPLVVPLQDIISGTYILTMKNKYFTYEQVCQLVGFMYDCDNTIIKIPIPCIIKPIKLWSGKQIFSMILYHPNYNSIINLSTKARNYKGSKLYNQCMCYNDGWVIIKSNELMCGNIDKNIIGSKTTGLFYRTINDVGGNYTALVMSRLTKLATRYLQNFGFSIGISDVSPTNELLLQKQRLLDKGIDEVNINIKQYLNGQMEATPGLTLDATLENILNQKLSNIRDKAGKVCIEKLAKDYNAALIMSICGSKGSINNISQMIALVGQQSVNGSRIKENFYNRTLPHFNVNDKQPNAKGFVRNSFFSGLTATEFFFHTMGGREGLVDTAVKTADTGYMQRRLMKNTEDVMIDYDNTVRNDKKCVIQFKFGSDGIDPMNVEDVKTIVGFKVTLDKIKSVSRCNSNINIINNILMPNDIKKYSIELINNELKNEYQYFRDKFITYINDEICQKGEQLLHDMNDRKDTVKMHFYKELYGLTMIELTRFINECVTNFKNSFIESGTAIGALSATSLGEPATQMTLKTFHFAGLASMNITQGVPRIKEILNVSKNIKTPCIKAKLNIDDSDIFARIVKNRIDKTKLGEICKEIIQVLTKKKCYIDCVLDLKLMGELYLQLTNKDVARTVKDNIKKILPSKLGISAKQIVILFKRKDIVRIKPDKNNIDFQYLQTVLHHIMLNVQNIIIQGIPSIKKGIISGSSVTCSIENIRKGLHVYKQKSGHINGKIQTILKDSNTVRIRDSKSGDIIELGINDCDKKVFEIYLEGNAFLDVMNTEGINFKETVTNDILETADILGIEAATQCIINELNNTYESHGLHVDKRHLCLMADLMTNSGKVLGFTRHGMGKDNKSVLTCASFEQTLNHLFTAAFYNKDNKIVGISDSIIVGRPIPIGTGISQLIRNPNETYIDLGFKHGNKFHIQKLKGLLNRNDLLFGESKLNDIYVCN